MGAELAPEKERAVLCGPALPECGPRSVASVLERGEESVVDDNLFCDLFGNPNPETKVPHQIDEPFRMIVTLTPRARSAAKAGFINRSYFGIRSCWVMAVAFRVREDDVARFARWVLP